MYEIDILSQDEDCITKLNEDIQSVFPALSARTSVTSLVDTNTLNRYTKDTCCCVLVDFDLEGSKEFVRAIQEMENHTEIIILSNDLHDAYKINDLDYYAYIYKQNINGYAKAVLTRLKNELSDNENELIKIRWKNTVYMVAKNEIIYIERERRKTYIHTINDEIYSTYMKLDDIYNLLGSDFLRVHFSYAINMNYVKEYHRNHVFLEKDQFIPISRKYTQIVKEYFEGK